MARIRTRARAVDMLGRQQIATVQNALSELFKNAYDAYAKKVRVDFFEGAGPQGVDLLLVRDDGVGMTLDDFETKWLVLGTESKLGAQRAKHFRPPEEDARPITGEKGIGRLAIALLGSQVLVLTRARRADGLHDLVACWLHWGLFQVPGLNLDDIELPVETFRAGTLPTKAEIAAMRTRLLANVDAIAESHPDVDFKSILQEIKAFDPEPSYLDSYLREADAAILSVFGEGTGTHFIIAPANPVIRLELQTEDREADCSFRRLMLGFYDQVFGDSLPAPITTSFKRWPPDSPIGEEYLLPETFFTSDESQNASDHYLAGDVDVFGQFLSEVSPPVNLGGLRRQESNVDEAIPPDPSVTKPPPDSTVVATALSYHPRQLMESFANAGIVCALYEPLKQFTTDQNSVLFRLCARADIVILDWDLHGDDSDGVSKLLAELIRAGQAQSPHHVRLCAIYTDKPNLHQVLDALLKNLEAKACTVEVAEQRLHLIAGATRISIFGKPGSAGRVPDEKAYEVTEAKLAEKIIAEFAGLHHGILPAFALHGLAAVRKNTKRLLDKFSGKLDGAFLLHRALTLGGNDAFHELPELLSDEIRAILEDAWPGAPGASNLNEVTRAAVDVLELSAPLQQWKSKQEHDVEPKAIFKQFLLSGTASLTVDESSWAEAKDLKKNGFHKVRSSVLKDFEAMLAGAVQSGLENLAALFSNRTQYGDAGRKLNFGTVVRHKNKADDPWSYSVCLMPICDSQRLTKAESFPFWKLKDDAKSGQQGKRFGIAVEVDGKMLALAAGGKIRNALWMAKFQPASKGWIETGADQRVFASAEHIVEWIAELKPLHAQRIAAFMGAEISRVGLVESEWLRLFCDR